MVDPQQIFLAVQREGETCSPSVLVPAFDSENTVTRVGRREPLLKSRDPFEHILWKLGAKCDSESLKPETLPEELTAVKRA